MASADAVRGGARPGRCGGRTGLMASISRRLLLLVLVLVGLGLLWGSLAGQRSRVSGVAHHGRGSRLSLSALPLVAQGVVSGALGAGTQAYRVAPSVGGFRALNPAQGLRERFGRWGVLVASGGLRLGLSLRAVGYGSRLAAVGGVAPRGRGNRVVYARAGLSEWYANGPLGLEQGFTVTRAPVGRVSGPLTLQLALSGSTHPSLAAGGQSLLFSGRGRSSLHYGGLVASDASGQRLHSWLALKGGQLLLRVDVRGARYPLRIDPFVQQGRALEGSEETEKGGAAFGYGVALSADGNTALVGGPFDGGAKLTGAAWVFTRSEGKWSQQGPKLTGSEESMEGRFGWTVALSSDGNTALIGGYTDTGQVGAAWVFTRSEGKWSQQGPKLTGGKEESGKGQFGWSVALSSDGNTAVIGGPSDSEGVGAAWVFTRSEGKWSQQGPKLRGGEETGAGTFGTGVALSSDGNTALIGGAQDNTHTGAAWVFTRSKAAWSQQSSKLTGAGQFGTTVALSSDGNTALVGGPFEGLSGGAAWVFTRSEGKWSQQTKLTGGTRTFFEPQWKFGYSVALSSNGNTALIGGPEYPVTNKGGAAWVFVRSEGKWSQQEKLTGGLEQTGGLFGFRVALSSDANTALVGKLGAVWVFTEQAPSSITTSLAGEGKEGETLTVLEGATVKDKATLAGKNASKATGKLTYKVYSDKECKTLVTTAGEVTVSGENVPASIEETLTAGASYYWQARYTGDPYNSQATSPCTEISNIAVKTSLSTTLSGEGKEGEMLTVLEGSKVKDKATLSGKNASKATGKVTYKVYSDKECKTFVTSAGEVTVSGESVPTSSEEELEGGKTYYWQAHYGGDSKNAESTSACTEVVNVKAKTTLSTKLSGESRGGEELTIEAGSKAKDTATLSGANSSTATGTLTYAVYSDSKCEHPVTESEVELEAGAKIPDSAEMELEGGNTYYWRAYYNGDALHQETASSCTEILTVQAAKYAALGDSYSSGEGTNRYYGNVTNNPEGEAGETQVETIEKEGYSAVGNTNQCHRSPKAYPVFVAEALFGAGAGNEVFAQQPRKFIFRACSGAIMENLWPGKGRWPEWVENVNGVAGKEEWFKAPVSGPTFPAYGPEQDSWLELPGGIPYELHVGEINANRGIGVITFSIGGNDAGFATIAGNCAMSNNDSLNRKLEYSLTRCEEALKEWETGTPGQWYRKAAEQATKEGKIVAPFSPEGHGLLSILSGLPTVFTDMHKSAPNATISVVLYPQIFDINGPNTITISGSGDRGIWLGTAPVTFYNTPVFYLGKAQAEKLSAFEVRLNGIIKTTAEKWAEESRARVVVIDTEKHLKGVSSATRKHG
jgi:hypothetical protein